MRSLYKYFAPCLTAVVPFLAVTEAMPERPLAWGLAFYGAIGWVLMWAEGWACDKALAGWDDALKLVQRQRQFMSAWNED